VLFFGRQLLEQCGIGAADELITQKCSKKRKSKRRKLSPTEVVKSQSEAAELGNLDGSAPASGGSSHRVLIFAQLTRYLDIIQHDLLEVHFANVQFRRIDGAYFEVPLPLALIGKILVVSF